MFYGDPFLSIGTMRPVIKIKQTAKKTVCFILVGVTGLEPAASWSRTMRATKLRYTPEVHLFYTSFSVFASVLPYFSEIIYSCEKKTFVFP